MRGAQRRKSTLTFQPVNSVLFKSQQEGTWGTKQDIPTQVELPTSNVTGLPILAVSFDHDQVVQWANETAFHPHVPAIADVDAIPLNSIIRRLSRGVQLEG
jgi:hypothetical protein